MARRCAVTGKGVLTGHNVSHSQIKTKRRFLPNLQNASFLSDALGETIQMRVSMAGLRTIEKRGGLDAFLLSEAPTKLAPELRALRKRVEAANAAAETA